MRSKGRTLIHQDWSLLKRKTHYKDIGIEKWQEKTQQDIHLQDKEDIHLQGKKPHQNQTSSSLLLNF